MLLNPKRIWLFALPIKHSFMILKIQLWSFCNLVLKFKIVQQNQCDLMLVNIWKQQTQWVHCQASWMLEGKESFSTNNQNAIRLIRSSYTLCYNRGSPIIKFWHCWHVYGYNERDGPILINVLVPELECACCKIRDTMIPCSLNIFWTNIFVNYLWEDNKKRWGGILAQDKVIWWWRFFHGESGLSQE